MTHSTNVKLGMKDPNLTKILQVNIVEGKLAQIASRYNPCCVK